MLVIASVFVASKLQIQHFTIRDRLPAKWRGTPIPNFPELQHVGVKDLTKESTLFRVCFKGP